MATEYVKVTSFVRGVVNGKVVVRRPGARIPVELAMQLGVIDAPPAPGTKPARPAGATPPKRRGRR